MREFRARPLTFLHRAGENKFLRRILQSLTRPVPEKGPASGQKILIFGAFAQDLHRAIERLYWRVNGFTGG
jgi:hypothetical protein